MRETCTPCSAGSFVRFQVGDSISTRSTPSGGAGVTNRYGRISAVKREMRLRAAAHAHGDGGIGPRGRGR